MRLRVDLIEHLANDDIDGILDMATDIGFKQEWLDNQQEKKQTLGLLGFACVVPLSVSFNRWLAPSIPASLCSLSDGA